MHESGDEDDDYFFECCENYDTCFEEKFKNIHFEHYFIGICDDCEKTKQTILTKVFDSKKKNKS